MRKIFSILLKPKTKYEYKSPAKPLPHKDPQSHAKIGGHKIGEDERPVTAKVPSKAKPAADVTATTPVVNDTTNNKVTTTTTTSTPPKTIDFPSSLAATTIVSAATTTTSKPSTTLRSDGPVRTLSNDERKLIKSKQNDAIEYLKQRAGFKLDALEKSSTNTTTTKKELKAREKQAEKVRIFFKQIVKKKEWSLLPERSV